MTARSGDLYRPRRTWGQRLVIIVNCMLILGCLGAAAGLELAWSQVRQIRRLSVSHALDGQEGGAPDTPQNYLIVGVDSAEGLVNNGAFNHRPSGLRSDTIMVLRVDPGSGQAQLLSVPRDLWVPISGTAGSAKINSIAGADQLIETTKAYLGIRIDHYVQVDFAGFESIVEAVGGLPLNFTVPLRDQASLLHETPVGCVTLDPDQALAFARSRKMYAKINGKWKQDYLSDLGRIDRQQELIRVVIQRAIAKGIRDPRVLTDLVTGGLKTVEIDDTLSPRQLIDLGTKFRTFTSDALRTYTIPTVSQYISGQDALLMQSAEAQPLLALFRDQQVDVEEPGSVLVQVHNGTVQSGLAAKTGASLRALGFNVPQGNALDHEPMAQSVITYAGGGQDRARLLARFVRGKVSLQEGTVVGGDVDLVIGTDWQGLLDQPKPESEVPVPTTTTPSSSSPSSTVPPATLPPSAEVADNRAVFVPLGC